ncbi:hypothetical protein KY362_03700 [Candidatus Woesearchaeota archaeon]|nr:hypothetical protein [Candidatus Woesearchaeota archaeon]
MKLRYLAIVAIAILMVFAMGCGKKEAPAPAPAPVAPPPAPEPAPAPAQETTTEEAEAAEGVVEVPETAAGEGLVTDDALTTGDYVQHSELGEPQFKDTALAKDLTASPERFSNFECRKNEEGIRYISVKVTNTNADRPLLISPKGVAKGYDTYFLVRGLVDMDPGCAVEELGAGESTVCTKIGPDTEKYGNPAGINKLNIQSPDNDGKKYTESVVVNCPE